MSAAAETINVQEKLSSSLLPERNDSNSHLTNGPVNLFAPDGDETYDDPDLNGIHDDIDPRTSLVSPSDLQFDSLVTTLKKRLSAGHGETIFEVGAGEGTESGLNADDYEASVATLKLMAQSCNSNVVLLREKIAEQGTMGEFLVRKILDENDFMEVRVAVVGNVDAGKSTLLGVLTHGELDNGRGTARMKLFRHKHEMESGRTSSVGNDILGFDGTGNVVNKAEAHGAGQDWLRICKKSSKVITFIDLAGHEKYLKTTIFGMTGHVPDFAMLMVGSNAGIIGMTKEHLGLALALNVPVFVVVTKIDMCPPNVLQETMKLLTRILKSPGCRKIPVMVQNKDDVVVSATNFMSEKVCPIFQISNVTGENLDLLKMFMNLLSVRCDSHDEEPAEFQIDETYSVPGVGTVISGTCMQGIIRLNDSLLLGPDPLGQFHPISIRSIHRKRMPVKEVRGGQTASFSLKKVKRSHIRKGMVMLDKSLKPQSCWEFDAEVLILHHPTTISCKYQAMIHCNSLRQTATIIKMSQAHLRTGDKANVTFRFIKHPEFLKPNTRMIFREGRTKAVGTILKIDPDAHPPPQVAGKIKHRGPGRGHASRDKAKEGHSGPSSHSSAS